MDKTTRYLSLDLLRGLTIFGMVFCAIIPYGVLPAWMYHIQNPPPTHQLDMTIAGLSWVDMVFPIFIFCMGVSIPMAGRAKIESGTTAKRYITEVLGRFIMLWAFSYLYVFLNYCSNRAPDGSSYNPLLTSALTIAGFLSLFPLYTVFKGRSVRFVCGMRILGIVLCLSIITAGHYFFNETITLHRRGIIIFLLAFLYLFGALIWYFTRDSYRNRALIFGLILCITMASMYEKMPAITYANPKISWWFNVEYIYFLLLLLPATFIGDTLQKRLTASAAGENIYKELTGKKMHIFFPTILVLVIWVILAVYMRWYWLNLIVSCGFLVLLRQFVKRDFAMYRTLFVTAAYLLVCGLIIEPIDGGLKKVPCTIQYCLVTCALSIFLLMFCDYVCKHIPDSLPVKILTGAGKNPLMSYIAFDSFMMPLMKLTGFIYLYNMAYPAGITWAGIIRAASIVLFTMWCVSLLSKRKIYWKA